MDNEERLSSEQTIARPRQEISRLEVKFLLLHTSLRRADFTLSGVTTALPSIVFCILRTIGEFRQT